MAVKAQDNYMVRCRSNPDAPLRHFFLSTCIIYFQCSCGQKTSYSKEHKLFECYRDHYDVFKVFLKPVGEARKDWDVYFNDIKSTIESDPEKYKITWDTLR